MEGTGTSIEQVMKDKASEALWAFAGTHKIRGDSRAIFINGPA